MPNPKALQELVSYLPRTLVADIANHANDEVKARLDNLQGAVLFADIAGFTPLVEEYSKLGPRGTEKFTMFLNEFFSRVINCVTDWGGDVEKIAGDALLAFWAVPETRDVDIYGVALQAARCALELQNTLNDFEVDDGMILNMRIALVTGDLVSLRIGGAGGRWQFLLAGDPMLEIDKILHDAEPAEIVVSRASWTFLKQICEGKPLESGNTILTFAGSTSGRTPQPPVLPPLESFDSLSSYVPRNLRKRLAAGQHDWLSELRPVSVLFISLEGLVCQSAAHLPSIQHTVETIQRILYHYGGSLRQFTMDDKGPLAMALFGLPLHMHEDDADRSLMAALEIHAELDSTTLNCRCGITYGNAFCGTVGNDIRREYAIVATAANLAARLMHSTNSVACDAASVAAASSKLQFDALQPLQLKGHADPVPAYRPYLAENIQATFNSALVGRQQQVSDLKQCLEKVLAGKIPGHVLLSGEPGLGKSSLLDHVSWLAREKDIRVFKGLGNSIDSDTPYLPWRQIFTGIMEINRGANPDQITAQIEQRFEDQPEFSRLAPLLGAVLETDLADNELTTQMRGKVRARNTRNLLISILREESQKSPLVLIIDDGHWVDATSWELLLEVSLRIESIFIIIAFRPFMNEQNPFPGMLAESPRCQSIELEGLAPQEIGILLSQTLGVPAAPESVVRAVQSHAGGNAFYCQQLVCAIRDAGVIHIENGHCKVTGNLDDFEFPASVEKVINSRVDRLTPEHQLTLKVASVIGRIFELQSLARIHPIESDRPRLSEYLEQLAELDFTPLKTPPPEQKNEFKHAITQEVLYSQLLFSQRCKLHESLAEWLELKHAGQIDLHSATLAYHWNSASLPGQAFRYFRIAAESALRGGAYAQAIHFLTETLNCLETMEETLPLSEHASLYRMLGEAHLSLGDFENARSQLEKALVVLGRPWPKKLGLATVREIRRQVLHRLGMITGGAQADLDLEESRAVEYLGHIFYFNEENSANVLSNLRGLNLLERLGPSARLASSYVQVGVIFSVVGLPGLAKKYMSLGEKTLPKSADATERMMFANYSSLITIPRGDWARSEDHLEDMHEQCLRIGDRHYLRYNRSIWSIMMFMRGEIERCEELREELQILAASGAQQIRCWAAIELAEVLELKGASGKALELLDEAVPLLEYRGSTEKIWLRGLRSRLLMAEGQVDSATQEALSVLEIITANPPTGFYALEGYAAVADVLLDSAAAASGAERKTLLRAARKVSKTLMKFARVFPVGKPRALFIKARLAKFSSVAKSQKLFKQALFNAQQLDMPLEEKRARQSLN